MCIDRSRENSLLFPGPSVHAGTSDSAKPFPAKNARAPTVPTVTFCFTVPVLGENRAVLIISVGKRLIAAVMDLHPLEKAMPKGHNEASDIMCVLTGRGKIRFCVFHKTIDWYR